MTIFATLHTFALQLLAQTEPAAPSSAPGGAPAGGGSLFGGGTTMILVYILIFVGMYFLMIAPQRKKQKQHQKMLSELDTGDQILTSGGIYGEITNRKEDRFVVRIADGTKVEIAKGFIQAVVKRKSGEDTKS